MVGDILKDLREELNQVPQKLREVPERLKAERERLREAPDKLQARGKKVGRKLKGRLSELREEGEERAWELEKRALQAAGGLLERASEVPVVSTVAPRVEGAVQERLAQISRPPVEGYDDLSVRGVRETLRGLGRVDLLKIARYEEAHKNRKTVLADVEAELKRRRADQAIR
jgi:Skp family chaperone for outer membrane proteins